MRACMRVRLRWVPCLLIAASVIVLAGGGVASAHRSGHYIGSVAPGATNDVDCNGWSDAYTPARPMMRSLCTDPIHIGPGGKTSRLIDNGWYVGHDEPSVKFISSKPGSANTMTYEMQLPLDPQAAPTANASVSNYGELSIAPWFGLPMCDPNSYPQNPCKPDSDSNSGAITNPNAAGSAFMELQFYPPGFTPFIDSESCSPTQWCSALTIDSLECTFNFASCNTNCIEPVNFAMLQTNGVPAGPAAPQDPNVFTWLGNAQTLKMNPGDVLVVSITDPAAGFTTAVHDLTTGQTGFMVASASNGFTTTNLADCSGTPHTWHAEYSTAQQQNQVPWAALEGGVLMQQEIGHFESCDSVKNAFPLTFKYKDGTSYSDPNVFQTCGGGLEGPNALGEGPCNASGTSCSNATTQGFGGPTACPTADATTGALCEFSDAPCFPAGQRQVTINGNPATESSRVNGCLQTGFQNGDLDFEGNPYRPDWPDGSANTPTTMRYIGPFTVGNTPYPQVQFESDAPGSQSLCDVATGTNCQVPPIGADFYPFWTLNNSQTLPGTNQSSGCVWNFGNVISGLTNNDLGRMYQYGAPDTARYAGTTISDIQPNPALSAGCGAPVATSPPTITGTPEEGQTLTATQATWDVTPQSVAYQWYDCDASGNNCTPIPGAVGSSYTANAADVGHTLRVEEDVPGPHGTVGRSMSAPTGVVVQAPPANVSAPSISGNTTQNQTLTASPGSWTNNPTSFGYQWEDCNTAGTGCSPITGATSPTYTLTANDVGHTIVVLVTAKNATGSSAPASSPPTGVVQTPNGPPTAPSNSAAPTILGIPRVGATLRATTGLWQGTPVLRYSYQWQRCHGTTCSNIAGATSSTYRAAQGDLGSRLAVAVTATNAFGHATASSAEVGPVAPSVAAQRSLLRRLLRAHGKSARIGRLLAHGGLGLKFRAPGEGFIGLSWWHGRSLVATATVRIKRAGHARGRFVLTLKGGQFLTGRGRVKLTGKGTYYPTGVPSTSVRTRVTLRG